MMGTKLDFVQNIYIIHIIIHSEYSLVITTWTSSRTTPCAPPTSWPDNMRE